MGTKMMAGEDYKPLESSRFKQALGDIAWLLSARCVS